MKIGQRGLRVFLRAVGAVALVVGLVGLYYGPLEIYCFYLFSEGGKFAYPEFGFGSLWFGYLVAQNTGYYIVAAVLIPIGIGMIRLRRWALVLIKNALYVGMAFAFSLLVWGAFSIPKLAGAAQTGPLLIVSAVLVVLGLGVPFALLKILQWEKIAAVFELDEHLHFLSELPSAMWFVLTMNLFFILLLHLSIFFMCIFPWFGRIILHREGIHYICTAIVVLAVLTYGFVKRKRWGLWGLAAYGVLMLVSTAITYWDVTIIEMINLLAYSAYEMENMVSVVSIFHDLSLLPIVGAWGLTTLGAVWRSRVEFK